VDLSPIGGEEVYIEISPVLLTKGIYPTNLHFNSVPPNVAIELSNSISGECSVTIF